MDTQQNITEAFSKLFQAKNPFPRWFQPHPEIGQILVHTQEEEDELRGRDWKPKPLPGSESKTAAPPAIGDVAAALSTLQAERELFEAQKRHAAADLEAKMADLRRMIQSLSSGVPSVSPPPEAAPPVSSGADVPGGLSDASEEVDPEPPVESPPEPKHKKK